MDNPNKVQLQLRERGGALWAVNRYREDALTALLDDLVLRRHQGFKDFECERVQLALNFTANHASTVPDGSIFGGTLLGAFEKFLEAYVDWNNSGERNSPKDVAARDKALKQLRRARQRIARRTRKTQHVMDNGLDLALVEAQYNTLGKLVEQMPKTFLNLAGAIRRFHAAMRGIKGSSSAPSSKDP